MSKHSTTKKQKQSFRNLHLTSTISISLVLFLIGLTCLMILITRDLSTQVKENISISIILDDNIDNDYIKRIDRYLSKAPYAKSTKYITKEEALKEHIENLGEDPEKFLGYNPLLASYEIKLNSTYANNDSVDVIEQKLKTFEHINRVVYHRDMVNLVNDNIRKISLSLLAITIVLLFISIALINNTIRLAIYSNRFLINTMKLVGATSWFIRKPYIKQSILNGFIAGVLAIVYLGAVLYYARNSFGLESIKIHVETLAIVGLIIIAIGILITGIASYLSVGRYIRMKTNDMYFV